MTALGRCRYVNINAGRYKSTICAENQTASLEQTKNLPTCPRMTQTQDPAIRRAALTYRHIYFTLTACLPPPRDNSPEALHERNEAAVATAASLCPVTAAEAVLAAQYVAAAAHAQECIQAANTEGVPLAMSLKCTAQAASMMRQSQSAIRSLQRMQAIRIKRDSDEAAAEAAAMAEHIAASSMTTRLTPPTAAPEPPPPEPDGPEPEGPAAGRPEVRAAEVASSDRADAALYAALYPQRAALIRRHGGVPPDATFGPPDAAIMRALLESRSPLVRALDSEAV